MTPTISGTTRLYAILADPIAQVKTPQGLNAVLEKRGVDGVLVPMHVPAADLATVIAGLRKLANFGGFIATVPHKKAVLDLVDRVSERAQAIGAANVVRRLADGSLVADMLDGEGFVAGLRRAGFDPAGRRVYLAGAGGAGNAIAFALADAGITHLSVYNRTAETAQSLMERLRNHYPELTTALGTADPSGHDLVVNATVLGMAEGDALPFDADRLAAGTHVAEIIMQPAMTPMLERAGARGCILHPGKQMLECQLELMADVLGMTP